MWQVLTKNLMDETFEITGIPDRDKVRFHPVNDVGDTEGCPLLAEKLGNLFANRAILNSGRTFMRFMAFLEDYDEFILTIYEAF